MLTRYENCVSVIGNGPRALPDVGMRAVSLASNGPMALPAMGCVTVTGNGPRALLDC